MPGNHDQPPYLLLQEDLREGNDVDGEWLFVNGSHWQDIDEVLIYSFIYAGTDNWQGDKRLRHPLCPRTAADYIHAHG